MAGVLRLSKRSAFRVSSVSLQNLEDAAIDFIKRSVFSGGTHGSSDDTKWLVLWGLVERAAECTEETV